MIAWREPAWDPSWLVPSRLRARDGFSRGTADIAARGQAAARSWRDDAPAKALGAGAAWVLVGGAGFLGARIVAQLLAEGSGPPVVVVARRPERLGVQLGTFLSAPRVDTMLRSVRLHCVAADLHAERDWIDAVPPSAVIIHLAARVHALAGWDALAPVNLHALRGSVALARRDGALLQLASSLSVFVSSNLTDADAAAPMPSSDRWWLHGGYAQTKAAAEVALLKAGLPRWQVIRYGLLVPEPGRDFPAGHFAPAFVQALDRIGALPDAAEAAAVDLTPVDGAAAAAIRLARGGTPGWTHWANRRPATLAALLRALADAGRRWPMIPQAAWHAGIATLPGLPRLLLRAAFAKTRFLADDAVRGPWLNVDLFQATGRCFLPASAPAPPAPEELLPGVAASLLAGAA